MRIKKRFEKMYRTTIDALLKNNYWIKSSKQTLNAVGKTKYKIFFLKSLGEQAYDESSKTLNEILNADKNTYFLFLAEKKGILKKICEYFQTHPIYYKNRNEFEKRLKNCVLKIYNKNFKKEINKLLSS